MITKSLTGAVILFIVTIIYMANTGNQPDFLVAVLSIEHGDKVAHFLLMGILSCLINLQLRGRTITRNGRQFLLGTVVVMAVVLLEELSQIFIPARSFSFGDLTADFFGIVLFGWLGSWLSRLSPPVNQPNG